MSRTLSLTVTMTLPKYTDFSHFARDLFIQTLGFKFYNRYDRFDVRDAIPIVDDMSSYCIAFTYTYEQEFLSVFRQAEYDEFKTEERFLRYAIPRCLNIVVPEFYFYSLLLVSAFLREFLEFLGKSRRCYRFHMVAYKCYVAVFKRAFESSFESHGGMEGLEEYLEELKKNYPMSTCCRCECRSMPEDLELQDAHFPPQVRSIIENCCPLDDDFVLNEFERSLLAIHRVDEFLDQDLDLEQEDPLGFEWPIRREQVLRRLEFDLFEYDDSSFEEEEVEEYSDLSRYANALESEAQEMMNLSTREFFAKMKNRMCPCCGIRCCQFSSALLDKQLAMSLKRTPVLKKYLLRFIKRCQERITWLIRFSRVQRRRTAVIAFYQFIITPLTKVQLFVG